MSGIQRHQRQDRVAIRSGEVGASIPGETPDEARERHAVEQWLRQIRRTATHHPPMRDMLGHLRGQREALSTIRRAESLLKQLRADLGDRS